MLWAWACGFAFCTDHRGDHWDTERAIEVCGYPVFSELTPIFSMFEESTDSFICHLEPQTGASKLSAYHPGDGLDVRLSRLKFEAACRPVAAAAP